MTNLRRGTGRWWGALALAGLGVAMIAVSAGFFGYVSYARNRLDDISVPPLASAQPNLTQAPIERDQGNGSGFVAPIVGADPIWDEALADRQVASGFIPVSEASLPASGLGKPTRVRIPAIGLDSEVMQLEILDLEDARQYQTPPQVVGHIPKSANPGEVGNSWLFGHLESPIRGEGSIFAELPEIHDLLRQGRTVYVIVDSEDGEFLYRVRDFKVIPREELRLEDSSERAVTLVTCWPRFVYDERIVVTTELVGAKVPRAQLDSPTSAG
ncbi:MAG: sortase [Candidatus Brocadiia bacterium]|nr:sortase [Candidatus Brocadiia bacterium]